MTSSHRFPASFLGCFAPTGMGFADCRGVRDRELRMPRHGAESAAGSDAVLLNQVDAQVSRTAPSSMEPLMKLVVQE